MTDASLSFLLSLIGGSDYKLIYRHYATLYFVFCVDSSESELGILDLIQVKLRRTLPYSVCTQLRRWTATVLVRELLTLLISQGLRKKGDQVNSKTTKHRMKNTKALVMSVITIRIESVHPAWI